MRLLPARLDAPMRWGRPRRVFVNSMSDVFHPRVPYDFINDIFDVMRVRRLSCVGHVFQVLTKRPGRAVGWWQHNQARYSGVWPDGVWIGTSVENQKYAASNHRAGAATGGGALRLGRAVARSG